MEIDENETGIEIIRIPEVNEIHGISELEVKQETIRTKLNDKINSTKCFWCRNSFSGEVFSIPVKYNPSHYPIPNGTAETKSFVQKEVTIAERKIMEEEKIPVIVEESFDLDGVFCSGECRQAFLDTNIQDPIYRDSIALLKMYDSNKYVPAMSWKTLEEYGGCYDIDTFRRINSSKKVEYRENVINIGEKYLERDFI